MLNELVGLINFRRGIEGSPSLSPHPVLQILATAEAQILAADDPHAEYLKPAHETKYNVSCRLPGNYVREYRISVNQPLTLDLLAQPRVCQQVLAIALNQKIGPAEIFGVNTTGQPDFQPYTYIGAAFENRPNLGGSVVVITLAKD
ncbi:hypothetical protein A2160_05130 [Candidatus Beckwithbacteria bacterium RBG_13_42_9]|uniref:Uncharacterized protein n=1 Tax=Candidatus Beckwithbacteria bacterium RBG_13_42_9 TaxID=1797457 RepID=A0A1F5E6S3_9BACT|nr:MAG: hypothetical protein A2160_05130 [Candidatus Beckwithbacteria bacterium RBG_13_42_9]